MNTITEVESETIKRETLTLVSIIIKTLIQKDVTKADNILILEEIQEK